MVLRRTKIAKKAKIGQQTGQATTTGPNAKLVGSKKPMSIVLSMTLMYIWPSE